MVKSHSKQKIETLPKSTSPAMRKMFEQAKAKAEKRAMRQESQGKNFQIYPIDESFDLQSVAMPLRSKSKQKSLKTLKRSVPKTQKLKASTKQAIKGKEETTFVPRQANIVQQRAVVKKQHKVKQNQAELKNAKTVLESQKIKSKDPLAIKQRTDNKTKDASMQRQKIKKAKARRAKTINRSIKDKDGNIVSRFAVFSALKLKKISEKTLKESAKQSKNASKALTEFQNEEENLENQALDDSIATASQGANKVSAYSKKFSKKTTKTDEFPNIRHSQDASSATNANHTTDTFSKAQKDASSLGKQSRQDFSSASTNKTKITPKQKPTMQNAKTRDSLKNTGSAIKDKSNVVRMKQNELPVKNRLAKRKQIKKAKMAQQKSQQKATTAIKKAGKRAVQLMKQAIEKTAVAIKSIIAAIGGGGFLIILFLLVFIVGFLAASPFGLFMSNDTKNGRPLQEVIIELDNEMRAQASGVENEQEGETFVGNWIEVVAVFAVRTTMTKDIGQDVGVLDPKRVDLLREVMNDMNKVTTKQVTETTTDDDGNTQTITKTVATVESKTAYDMADFYHFDNDQRALLDELLSPEYFDLFMELLGEIGTSGTPLTKEELDEILKDLPTSDDATVQKVIELAASRLGDPYSQPKRGQGNYVDCSYFIKWIFNQVGVPICDIAAYQGQWIDDNNLAISQGDLQAGDLVFWSFGSNGRYKQIDHVGIYIGGGMVIDASSSKGKVVKRSIFSTGNQAMYGRPLAYGK